MSETKTDRMLAETRISGLDIPGALGRMGYDSKLYLRILHIFITKTPENLGKLATELITAETLPDYAIRIHGTKGSCYSIGANGVGDKAKALEMAANAGDLGTCVRTNDAFLAAMRELLEELARLEVHVKEAESDGRAQAAKPDKARLEELLAATRNYDFDQMSGLVDELTSLSYAEDGELVAQIGESLAAFDYQAIEEAIAAYLAE